MARLYHQLRVWCGLLHTFLRPRVQQEPMPSHVLPSVMKSDMPGASPSHVSVVTTYSWRRPCGSGALVRTGNISVPGPCTGSLHSITVSPFVPDRPSRNSHRPAQRSLAPARHRKLHGAIECTDICADPKDHQDNHHHHHHYHHPHHQLQSTSSASFHRGRRKKGPDLFLFKKSIKNICGVDSSPMLLWKMIAIRPRFQHQNKGCVVGQ